jgi:hypothetical protein
MRTTERSATTLEELTEHAVDLAARAMAYGLARLIEAYVPEALMDRFATRIAVVLIREIPAQKDSSVPAPPSVRS